MNQSWQVSPQMAGRTFKLALVQLAVGASKTDNLSRAVSFISQAAKNGAKVIALPECCNSSYDMSRFEHFAEAIPGESTEVFSQAAKDNNIYLIAGSIPEKADGKLYNTCTVFNPEGNLIAKHRKIHLFDINIPGKITFEESKTLAPGNSLTMFSAGFCKIGIGICYDIRFAELAQIYAKEGCNLVIYPGAFNMTTGPAHWELLQRARAVDNQIYVAAISPARDESASYVAWGHSMVTDPWGTVIGQCEDKEDIVYADIDLDYEDSVREQIPIRKQKRSDLYEVTRKQ